MRDWLAEWWVVVAAILFVLALIFGIWATRPYPVASAEAQVDEVTLAVIDACLDEAYVGVTAIGWRATLRQPDMPTLANCLVRLGLLQGQAR